jgi:biopolymer transport protein ExbD
MAEMINNAIQKGSKESKPRSKKHPIRVDLAAMVDLAFLLLTFFILATTFKKEKAMQVIKPAKNEDQAEPTDIEESKTLTLILGKDNRVFCYVGADDAAHVAVDSTFFSRTGLRAKIKNRQQEVAQQWGSADALFVLIKPLADAQYRNIVDVLDEMAITGIKRYAIIDDFSAIDEQIIHKTGNRKPQL